MTALDGFEAEKCAPSSTGAMKPLGGRQPAPPAEPEHGERGGSVGLGGGSEGGSVGGGEGGGGEGGGGEGAPIVTNTVAPEVIATSGGACTEAPSMADKVANGMVACASALPTRVEVSSETLTISSCRFTLAAVMARLAWQSGG